MKNIYIDFKKIQFILDNQYNKQFIIIFLSMVLIALFEVLSIGVLLPFFDIVLNIDKLNDDSYILKIKTFFNLSNNDLIISIGLFVIFVFLIKNIMYYFANKEQSKNLHQIRVDIARKMFIKYISMDYSQFLEKNISTMMYNATGLVNIFVLIYLQSLLKLFTEILIISFVIFMLFFINFNAMLIISLFIFIIVYFLLKTFKKVYEDIGIQEHNAVINMHKTINEGISALKEIKTLNIESYFIELFNKYSQRYQKTAVKNSTLKVIPKLFLEFIFISIVISTLVAAIIMQIDLKTFIPSLAVFAVAFFKILPSINRLINIYNELLSRKISLNTLYLELSEENPIILKKNIHYKKTDFKDMVSIENVTFAYENSNNILENFSLNIKKNTTVAFIGSSGSGKTTLVDIILGLLKPQKGYVKFDQNKVLENLESWYKTIAYIPQSISFIDDTIRNNIALGIDNVDEVKLAKALEDAQLKSFTSSLANGLDTMIGDKGVKLSGGQRQRLGIARALYKNPDILIFDEATSALDVETEKAITESIQKLEHHKTIIIIAHRLSTIKNCNEIFILKNGKIQDRGTYSELLEKNDWFQSINNESE